MHTNMKSLKYNPTLYMDCHELLICAVEIIKYLHLISSQNLVSSYLMFYRSVEKRK